MPRTATSTFTHLQSELWTQTTMGGTDFQVTLTSPPQGSCGNRDTILKNAVLATGTTLSGQVQRPVRHYYCLPIPAVVRAELCVICNGGNSRRFEKLTGTKGGHSAVQGKQAPTVRRRRTTTFTNRPPGGAANRDRQTERERGGKGERWPGGKALSPFLTRRMFVRRTYFGHFDN